MRKGVLAVGEKAKRKPDPEGEGDATPGRKPPGAALPRRDPGLFGGRIPHPLPSLSEQDAARIARLLAEERAELEGQRARRRPRLPLPARGPDVSGAPRLYAPPPWRRLTPEPAWHALGTMAGLPPDRKGGTRSGVSLADRPAGEPATETEPAGPEAGPVTAEADLVPSEPPPADTAPAETGLADTGSADAEPPAEADQAPAEPPDPAVEAVRQTFAVVQAAGDEAAAYFYGWMFVRDPELRKLFPTGMTEQRDRLFRAFARIVGSLTTPEEMATYLAQLGRDHRKYAVQPEMYEVVGEAVMATLRAYAGPAFTPAAEEAWAKAYQAVSSLMIAATEEDSQTSPPFWTAEVVSNEERRPGISILTVAPDLPLPYEPGQHISVQTPRWPKVWRPFSVACRPREDGLITFHIKAVPGGWVSSALVHEAKPGDELTLGPALGTMTLSLAGGRDLLCVAGGTGLSPIKAIIEEAIRESTACPRQIHLFYGARTRDELYDLPDLWHLADAYPGFQLTPVTSDDPAFDGVQGNVGRVAARYLPHRECETYVAGPPAMVRETVHVLARVGLPRERIHYDDALLADGE
jgi:NAD(P)H-flavin reductase/hemoglobin-like flavoprotein